MKKTAVVLFNLGGPDSKEAIKPFLFNFFMDPAIIGAPKPIRWCLAKYISIKRSGKEAGSSYAYLNYQSPLLENSEKQAVALEEFLNSKSEAGHKYKCFVCMRYWHPMSDQVVARLKDYGPDEIVLLPLYPQFSTTTSGSSFKDWNRAAKTRGLEVSTTTICCFPEEKGFIEASAYLIKETYEKVLKAAEKKSFPKPRILFSAHGLPEKIIEGGDPYQWQCEKTATKIAEKLGIKELDWKICYQSRVGPLKWIGPSTDKAIEEAAKEGVPVVIYPHAFVSEHVETLVDIAIEYKEKAERLGIPVFEKVETVGTTPVFIEGLASMVIKRAGKNDTAPDCGRRVCPAECIKCRMAN